MQWFSQLDPVWQAGLATLGTYLATAFGAAVVLLLRRVPDKALDAAVGFAAGVMIAASYWSLLAPSIEMAEESWGALRWFPPLVGFLVGAITLFVVDKILPHMHPDFSTIEGVSTSWRRTTLLVLAITMHNIPEGLAVGVAFGAGGHTAVGLGGAIALALGIGLQNIPEGAAVSLPLRREGMSRGRSFWYGQLSGLVEPLAGVAGALLAASMHALLPYALAFAAGAMIYVVADELIPESQRRGHTHWATFGVIVGFALMMTLDVAFG